MTTTPEALALAAKALEPFAAEADRRPWLMSPGAAAWGLGGSALTNGDLLAARTALQSLRQISQPDSGWRRVSKVTGYRFVGEVRSEFTNKAGSPRMVVEHDDGWLFIFNPDQVVDVEPVPAPLDLAGANQP